MEITIDDKESLFREGQRQSVIKNGEAHGYSQVLEGVNTVLKHLGRGYENALAVSDMWHNELCFFHSNPAVPLSDVVAAMAGALPAIIKTLKQMETERFDLWYGVYTDISTLQDLCDAAGFERRVEESVGQLIRKNFPRLRKRSQEYRELMIEQESMASAAVARADLHASLRLKERICAAVASRQRDLAKQAAHMSRLVCKISDIGVLLPNTSSVTEASAAARTVEARLTNYSKAFADSLDEIDKYTDTLHSQVIVKGVEHVEALLPVR